MGNVAIYGSAKRTGIANPSIFRSFPVKVAGLRLQIAELPNRLSDYDYDYDNDYGNGNGNGNGNALFVV